MNTISNLYLSESLIIGLDLAKLQLQLFAESPDFANKIKIAFGENADATDFQNAWLQGDFNSLPPIKILSASEINNANGAFSSETNTIYLSQEYLSNNYQNPEIITKVLLEEIGHFVDSKINISDAQGDEGAIFASLIQGETLNNFELQQLKSEDDTAIVVVHDQALQIEQSTDYYIDALLFPSTLNVHPQWLSNTISYNFMPSIPVVYLTGNALKAVKIDGLSTTEGFSPLDTLQQSAVEEALNLWAEVADLHFVRKEDSSLQLADILDIPLVKPALEAIDKWDDFVDFLQNKIGKYVGFPLVEGADLRFGTNHQGTVSSGEAYHPPNPLTSLEQFNDFRYQIADFIDNWLPSNYFGPSGLSMLKIPFSTKFDVYGDVWLNNENSTIQSNQIGIKGEDGFCTVLHEIGHALGLKHPGNYNAGGGGADAPFLPDAEDNFQYTLMSYNDGQDGRIKYEGCVASPSTPLLYDIAAIQSLYGANTNTRTGNDTYQWDDPTKPFIMAIWDAGGIDTIDASNQQSFRISTTYTDPRVYGVKINLNAGNFSSIGSSGTNITVFDLLGEPYSFSTHATNNLAIAFNTIIENAIGSPEDDELTGNNVANTLQGGEGNDTLNGNVGNDSLYGEIGDDLLIGGAGADILNGGDGFDIASYSTAKKGITINLTTGVHTGDAAGDTFVSIEQITGSPYNDKLTGSSANDILNGAKGNDTLNGSQGDDILIPDWGDDVVNGGDGIDTLVIDYSTLPTQAVAWVGDNQGDYYVYVRNAWGIGAPIKTNLNAYGHYEVDISADGTTVVTDGYLGSYDYNTSVQGILVKKIHSTSPPVRVSSPVQYGGYNPTLSGDGSKVVWTEYVDYDGEGSEIWIANTDGTQVRQLTNNDVYDGDSTISSDGSTIAWIRKTTFYPDEPEYRSIIMVANADGSNVRELVNDATPKDSLSLSADGSQITWSGYQAGVWVAHTDGTNIRQLTADGYTYSPSISADGSRVVWSGYDEAGDTVLYAANTDGSSLWTVPNTKDVHEFYTNSLSGDGDRVVFSKSRGQDANNNNIEGLYVASVNGTEPLTLIYTSSEYYQCPAISSYVDQGVSYKSFNSTTGSGEIFTWGPSRVRYSNIEKFDLIGTIYDDDLRGGNLEDTLTGGGGADTLKGGLGNDIYSLNPQNAAGSQIQDTGGSDTLELQTATIDSNGILQVQDFTLSLAVPGVGRSGMRRAGTTLIIDLNKDGIAVAKDDLSLINFFNTTGSGAGTGFIETVANLSGATILSQLQIGDDTINGGAGDDLIDGWLSNDKLNGGAGNDKLRGQDGNDYLFGGEGNDSLEGGIGNDFLTAGFGDDQINGGDGTDILVLDYSTLTTRAVAWSKTYHDVANDKWSTAQFVGNAFGLGTPLKLGENYKQFALSSDGTTYAYIEGSYYQGYDLWLKKIDGSNTPVKIAHAVDEYYSVELSSDGSKIAWRSAWSLFVANSNGTGQILIKNNPTYNYIYSFSLSDDGSQIAWIDSDGLFIANSNNTNIRQIASAGNYYSDCYLSANGEQIIWSGTRNGQEGIWWANTNSNLPQVNSLVDGSPTLSDSNGIKAIWRGLENYQLLNVSDTNNSSVQEVADSYWNNYVPTSSLAEDGAKVAFVKPLVSSDPNSLSGLYVGDTYRTGTATLISTGGSADYDDYSYSNVLGYFQDKIELSSSVDIGVRYQSFNLANGNGEINTWGPSHVKYTGIERFNIVGTNYGDDLRGGNLDDTLKGGLGNDTITPGLGFDSVDGGTGTDLLVVDYSTLTNDVTHTIGTTPSQLGDGVANTISYRSFEIFNLTTGSGKDKIIGGSGDDTLNGGQGVDTLTGNGGNDLYFVDNVGDLVVESSSLGGTDLINSSVNYTLPTNVENLTLIGTEDLTATGNLLPNKLTGNAGNNTLIGNNGHDNLIGNNGDDTLTGGLGNDTLLGGMGKDILTGGSGNDVFVFNSQTEGFDTIKDFITGVDLLNLKTSGFGGGLSKGILPNAKFVLGTAAKDSDDRFIFNSQNNTLFFDVDGIGMAAQRAIAIFSNDMAPIASDLILV